MKYDEPEAAVLLVACAIGLATGAAHLLLIINVATIMWHPPCHEIALLSI